jgi:hypothetical protein
MQPQLVNDNVVTALQAMLAATGLFDDATGVSMALFVNNIVPTPQTALGDLTEATFAGYAELTLLKTWSVGGVGGGQPTAVLDQPTVFTSSGPTSPAQTVYGWYLILPGTPNKLLVACRLDTPFLVADATVVIPITVQLLLPQGLLLPYPQ